MLWINYTNSRYFLIPIVQQILEGEFLIKSLTGTQKTVDLNCIAPFEITREEAKPYIQAELEKALKQTKQAFTTFTNFAATTQEKSSTDTQASQAPKNPLAALLGISQEQLNKNPDAVKESWQNLVQGFQDILQAATSSDSTHLDNAKTQMQRLQNYLQAQGIEVDDSIQELTNKLREKYHTSEFDPTLKASAEKLQEATQNLGQSFNNLLESLKDGANKVRETMKEAEANQNRKKSSEAHQEVVSD